VEEGVYVLWKLLGTKTCISKFNVFKRKTKVKEYKHLNNTSCKSLRYSKNKRRNAVVHREVNQYNYNWLSQELKISPDA